MNNIQRIRNVFVGLLAIVLSAVLFIQPPDGLRLIGLILSITLLVSGMRNIHYYFTMARHMVGGRNSLYVGVILFDLGLFAISANISQVYIIIYLLVIHAFSGVVDILLALDAKRMESSSWRLNLITGIGNLAIATGAVIFGLVLGNTAAVVDIYAAGLLYAGILRIINAFRRTAIVYIQ